MKLKKLETQKLINYWQERSKQLEEQLSAMNAKESVYHIKPKERQILWLDNTDRSTPLATADLTIIASYSDKDESLLMGWENPSLPDEVVPKPIDDLPGEVRECSSDDATQYAMMVAYTIEAEYLYPAKTTHNVIFLALWNLQQVEQEQAPLTSPASQVQKTLGDVFRTLRKNQLSPQELGDFFIESGEHLLTEGQTTYESTTYSEPLVKSGEVLVYAGREVLQANLNGGALPAKQQEDLKRKLEGQIEKWSNIE